MYYYAFSFFGGEGEAVRLLSLERKDRVRKMPIYKLFQSMLTLPDSWAENSVDVTTSEKKITVLAVLLFKIKKI